MYKVKQIGCTLGMDNQLLTGQRALMLIEALRNQILDPQLCVRHRRRAQDFTRQCQLTFPVMILMLLQKSVKSLQARIQEVLRELALVLKVDDLSSGAFTHARIKLNASAFVELNQQALLPLVYGPQYEALQRRWHGHRVLAVDSSIVRLPKRQAVGVKFGWMKCSKADGRTERYAQGRLSVLYDVLNQVALEGRLEPCLVPEEQMAHQHLGAVPAGDLILNDRGYTGFFWLWDVVAHGARALGRCSRSSFAMAHTLFEQDQAGVSVLTTLQAPKELRAHFRKQGWVLEVKVRFVTVRLKTG